MTGMSAGCFGALFPSDSGHAATGGGRADADAADGLPLSISVAAIYGSRLHLVKVTPSGRGGGRWTALRLPR